MSSKGRIAPLLIWPLAAYAMAAPLTFALRDTRGAEHRATEWRGKKAVVLFFVMTDCPVGNGYVPEMNRIRQAYEPRGVVFYAVQTEVSVPAAEVARYAAEYRYEFPVLVDPAQTLVRWTGASITPQAAVLSPDGRVLYLGRIDDRVADFGKVRSAARVQDLRLALDAVLAGRAVAAPRTKSVGCAINRVAH